MCIISDIVESLVSIEIDEGRKHVLTSITKTKTGTKGQESDHNSIVTKFNLTWKEQEIKPRVEEGKKKFKNMTKDNTNLSQIFDTEEDINTQTKCFIKKLDGIFHQCFTKVKIGGSVNKEVDELFKQQRLLRSKTDNIRKEKLKDVNRPIKNGLEEYQKLREEFCQKRVNNAKLNKTPDWDIEDVKFVIKNKKK